MFSGKLSKFKDVPIENRYRFKTDVLCNIIAIIFFIAMFITSIIAVNKENILLANFPTDSDNEPCAYGLNQNYPFIYFLNPLSMIKRVCVNKCPSESSSILICNPNSQVPSCAIPVYSTNEFIDRIGGYCEPTNSKTKELLWENAHLSVKENILNNYEIIWMSLLISNGIGFIWIILTQVMPRFIIVTALFLTILILAAGGTVLLLDFSFLTETSFTIKIILASFCFLTLIFLLIQFGLHFRRTMLIKEFLAWSANYTTENCKTVIYVPIFIVLTILFSALMYFQLIAFISWHRPSPVENDVYLKVYVNPILILLNFLELIWGIQFLKDSFNFLVSGLSAEWYTEREYDFGITFRRFCFTHLGSIVAGSFVNGFFNLINFVVESLRCYPNGPCGKCSACYSIVCYCADVFDLVRTDVYAYINLTGISYCNASRSCATLVRSSNLFANEQSLLYLYRICSYVTTVGITSFGVYSLEKMHIGTNSLASLFTVIILAFCCLSYFIDYHANVAEGLQICYLLERTLEQKINMNKFSEFKSNIINIEDKYEDNHFF